MGLTTKCNGGQTNVHITIQVFYYYLFIYYNFMENISLNFFFYWVSYKEFIGWLGFGISHEKYI